MNARSMDVDEWKSLICIRVHQWMRVSSGFLAASFGILWKHGDEVVLLCPFEILRPRIKISMHLECHQWTHTLCRASWWCQSVVTSFTIETDFFFDFLSGQSESSRFKRGNILCTCMHCSHEPSSHPLGMELKKIHQCLDCGTRMMLWLAHLCQ